ncbi:MAG: 2-aminoethylphosphonate--pyruvate transaminase, partial [Rikenellaceae bacterium]
MDNRYQGQKPLNRPYLLLTPGPLTSSDRVKRAMLSDWCTWDDDYNINIVQTIRRELLELAQVDPAIYTNVLLQGSGSYCVEAAVTNIVGADDKLLIIANGAYGERINKTAEYAKLNATAIILGETEQVTPELVKQALGNDPSITHVAVVHCETTTGILNPLAQIAQVVKDADKVFIVDAMSSFGGIPINMQQLGIDALISSANKCIQGVPGFGFIILRRDIMAKCKGRSRTLSLDIFDQWDQMEKGNGKWRFTSPTHVVRAFAEALSELRQEGGIEARYARYVASPTRV